MTTKPPLCTLYRTVWITDMGYVVYRHCFDSRSAEECARVHREATFVDEIAAKDYCNYRNGMVDENGDDRIR